MAGISRKYIRIKEHDTVVVCLQPMQKGEVIRIDGHAVELLQDVPLGHKVLICDTPAGADIIKYGYPIGHAVRDLKAGEWVHEHNLQTNLRGTLSYDYRPMTEALPYSFEGATFQGFLRKNGEVGIRNEIWIVPTVGCVNGVAHQIVERYWQRFGGNGEPSSIPIRVWHHNYGCSQLSDDHANTRKILRDIVLHPNAGGVLVLGLGCENNQPNDFMATLGDYDPSRVRLLVAQQVEGDEVDEGVRLVRELYQNASADQRQRVPLKHLCVGLKCGGSDGLSGITANPLVGEFSDWLIMQGGTTVLTEVPEMFGAEGLLMNRCASRALFEKTTCMLNDFKNYFLSHGEPVGENPSPGNKAGGISTLEDKALGCTQKGGRAPINGVLEYGERIENAGLNLLSAPGNDLVASTALAAAGCQLVLFTTGRGTPFGTFVPTVKISTNTQLQNRKPNWIDFDAGQLLDGRSFQELLRLLIAEVIDIASGKPAHNERNGYFEISIFKNGVTL